MPLYRRDIAHEQARCFFHVESIILGVHGTHTDPFTLAQRVQRHG